MCYVVLPKSTRINIFINSRTKIFSLFARCMYACSPWERTIGKFRFPHREVNVVRYTRAGEWGTRCRASAAEMHRCIPPGEDRASLPLRWKYYQKFHGCCSRGSDTARWKRGDAARHDPPSCPHALVYTSIMMVYGRWRRRPRSGRVGHAVNRRTQPRQNLPLYSETPRRSGESRAGGLTARLRGNARALSLITSSGPFRPRPCLLRIEGRVIVKLPVLSKTDALPQIMNLPSALDIVVLVAVRSSSKKTTT